MDWIDFLQWPAMLVTIAGAWWLAAQKPERRIVGFSAMVISNLLWIAWGWSDDAWALVALNVILMAMNVRGIFKNENHKNS